MRGAVRGMRQLAVQQEEFTTRLSRVWVRVLGWAKGMALVAAQGLEQDLALGMGQG